MTEPTQTEESKIVVAIKKFKKDYSWDRSLKLQTQVQINKPSDADSDEVKHSNTSIEDFLNAKRK